MACFSRLASGSDELTARRATLALAFCWLASCGGQSPTGPADPVDRMSTVGLPAYADALASLPIDVRVEVCREFAGLSANEPGEIEGLGDLFEATLGSRRRSTGSHFTPRALTRDTVAHALRPLLADPERPAGPEGVLSLAVCDPAMGGGAFLLEVCRALARALDRELGRSTTAISPASLRAVSDQCLFGLDRDPIAVEVARMSLWLLVRPPEGIDAFSSRWLRHGDALVGATQRDIEHFGRSGEPADPGLARAFSSGPRALEIGRIAGDLLVDVFLRGGSGADLNDRRQRRLRQVQAWLDQGAGPLPVRLERKRQRVRALLPPFHWELERPRRFDAFVGNPPFLGGKRISTVLGTPYAEWLQKQHGTSKNADLCAHFFRRAESRLGARGTISFIATNTISQGDTRTAALAPLIGQGFSIYRAVRSTRWPGSAQVSVSVVHLSRGLPAAQPELDGATVTVVDSRLRPRRERPDPRPIPENEGHGFVGCFLRGDGFVVSRAEREALVRRDARSAALVRPYIGGEEVNTSPTQTFFRYVIDLSEIPLSHAMEHQELFDTLRSRVKPSRDRLRNEGADLMHKRNWWKFANTRPELRAAIEPLCRCLVAARVTKHLSFSFQPTSRVFSEQLCVFAFDSFARFAVLESRVHEAWARLLSSSLGEGLRYLPSEAFDTFPFPDAHHLVPGGALDTIGRMLHDARASRLVAANFGLTALKNDLLDRFVADEETRRLRALYEDLDRAVLAAYRFADVPVPPYLSPLCDAERADLAQFEDSMIDRLYALNATSSARPARGPNDDGGVRAGGV